MPRRRPQARHLAIFAHLCPLTGSQVGASRAVRWAWVSRRPVREKPPHCPFCAEPMTLEAVSYQGAAAPEWDHDLERTRIILEALAKEGKAAPN